MLKAAIIYVQGSGGNLLSRTLSLCENTVAYLPEDLAQAQPDLLVGATQRLNIYNNWNSTDWTQTEKQISIWYKHGKQDFFLYESSKLWLIDQFHPKMFQSELQSKILFSDRSSWQDLIFIKFRPESLNTIKKLARLKRKDLAHENQIDRVELKAFSELTETHSGHFVDWEDFLQQASYQRLIQDLCQKLDLTIDMALAQQLWQGWKSETDKLLDE